MPFTWSIYPPILHGTYHHPSEIPPLLHQLATDYEGPIPHRTGLNLPLSSAIKRSLQATLKDAVSSAATWDTLQYLVVYPKADPQTRQHELLHARYHLDPVYRRHVQDLWDSLTPQQQDRARKTLRALQYPDNLLLDEFQAYYYTEKPRFFGIPISSIGHKKKRRSLQNGTVAPPTRLVGADDLPGPCDPHDASPTRGLRREGQVKGISSASEAAE